MVKANPNEFSNEANKPLDYNTILMYQIGETAKSFVGEVSAADKMVQALRSLLLPYVDKKFREEEKELMESYEKARDDYLKKWGADQQKVAWAYFRVVNKEFEILISCANRVYLLGGRNAQKIFVVD